MKRTVWLWQFFGFAFAALGGTLLHFLYEWLGRAVWIAPFSGVNESTWEHMKLLFWPMFSYAVFQAFFFKGYRGFMAVKLCGTLLGLALIPTLFYNYNGIVGKSPDWLNIMIFFISGAAAYIFEAKLLSSGALSRGSSRSALLGFIAIAILFVSFTFSPPALNIFAPPA